MVPFTELNSPAKRRSTSDYQQMVQLQGDVSSITAAFLFVVNNIERLCFVTAKAGNAAERENGLAQRRCMFLGGGGEHRCKTRRIKKEVHL